MTFAVVTNVTTMILCIAVLIQAVRLMRALDTVKGGALTDVVGALDTSTNEARRVLGKLTDLLRGDVAVTARTLSEGKSMLEELAVMTGIANAIAERIVEAAGASNRTIGAIASEAVATPPQLDNAVPPGPQEAKPPARPKRKSPRPRAKVATPASAATPASTVTAA